MPTIVLASASPRRRELLTQVGIPFRVVPGDIDENNADLSGTPEQKAERLAYMKAKDVASGLDDGLVIGADTIVVCGDEIFGKPADENDARRMLMKLGGREHQVITGIAVVDASSGKARTGHEVTRVRFAELTDREIEYYISSGEPFDKAGAYAIQGRAAIFVESLDGCYSNVVGLPLSRLYCLLKDFGVSVCDQVINYK
jgi:septum formation protein